MPFKTKRKLRCSGCIIDAIRMHDETRLRSLLSSKNVEYSDTYWVPSHPMLIDENDQLFSRFPMISSWYPTKYKPYCTHPSVSETLAPGRPANIALSVVLASMLHTTSEFNAFQIVVDSNKFDMNEPLIYHQRRIPQYNGRSLQYSTRKEDWEVVIVDPAAMICCWIRAPTWTIRTHSYS